MPKLIVDLSKYKSNIKGIKAKLKKQAKLCAVVKANAYGVGAKEISKATQNSADCFAVAFCCEGLCLREAGITKPILQLSPFEACYLCDLIKNDITLSVFCKSQLRDIEKTAKKLGAKANVQIKINSGMNRYGIKEKSHLESLAEKIYSSKNLNLAGVFSHLSARNEEFSIFQKDKFLKLTKNLHCEKHISASYGYKLSKDFHLDMVRVGIDLCGGAGVEGLLQAVSFTSKINAFQTVQSGEYVGYGNNFTPNQKIKIAIVVGGYADGVNRLISSEGYAIINKQKAKIVGSVCMDCFFCDVTNIKCKKGDEVEIFSQDNPLWEYAEKIKSIPYEALTQISPRTKRIYHD